MPTTSNAVAVATVAQAREHLADGRETVAQAREHLADGREIVAQARKNLARRQINVANT